MASPLTAGVTCWPAPTQSVTPGRALFAKGLAKGCTSAHLQAIFSTFGTVTDCQIARHRSGRSAGFAIVTFLRHEEAVAAMQAVDNLMFMGRRLSVKWFSPERALEGTSHGVDVLNMQALQHALQLTQLQPADLMAQLAQMLDSPRLAPQQPQNAHVSAWLDNFVLAQQQQQKRDSPLAQMVHDATQSQSPLDLLNFSGLSLTDVQSAGMGVVPPAQGLATHPATPSSLDVPDGAVYVTAGINTGNKGAAVGGNFALAHSRLAKWCTAPGSAGGQSSAAPSLTDDASSETASVHASDDSSIATSVQLAQTSCEMPSCSTEGSSPAGGVVLTETPHVTSTVAPPVSLPTVTVAPAPNAQVVTTPNSGVTLAPQVLSPVNSLSEMDETLLRNRALAAAAAAAAVATRPGVIGSDPGGSLHQPMVLKRGSAPTFGTVPPLMPGAPVLAPLRTTTTAQLSQSQVHHHHAHHHAVHHHHHAHHMARANGRQTAMPSYNSCGGGATAPTDASLQQALRLQQALAEQARTMSAQYMDALAKLEAAREQVVAAASLLNRNSGMAAAAAALPMPPPSLPPSVHQMPPQQMGALMGGHTMAPPMHPYLAQSPAAAQGCMPDFGSLFMFQNAASSMNRPLY